MMGIIVGDQTRCKCKAIDSVVWWPISKLICPRTSDRRHRLETGCGIVRLRKNER
jgi:hypothetical protein